jgi:hypothetical protein
VQDFPAVDHRQPEVKQGQFVGFALRRMDRSKSAAPRRSISISQVAIFLAHCSKRGVRPRADRLSTGLKVSGMKSMHFGATEFW